MESINKKILHTKQALWNALCSLIESKKIQDITVSQICRKANINRTTFYKYYSLPIDILSEHVEEICKQALREINKKYDTSLETDIYHIMLEICRIYYENKQLMKEYVGFNKDLLPIIQKFLGKFFGENVENVLEQNSLNCFISGGVIAIIFQWDMNDYIQPITDIAKMLTQYILRLNTTPDL